MPKAAARGAQGEELARQHLEAKGLRFVAANWRCKIGEIDLIMEDASVRVLVEVRTRTATLYGAGSDTVAQQKQRKLVRAAQFYQQKENYWGDIRFDVVSITDAPGQAAVVEHIESAFEQPTSGAR